MKRLLLLPLLLCLLGSTWSGSGSGDPRAIFDPTTTAYVKDEFIFGTQDSNELGDLGWNESLSGGSSVAIQNGEVNHPGILRLITGAAATNRAAIRMNGFANHPIDGDDLFDTRYIIRLYFI